MLCSSFFTSAFFLANAVATLTTAGGGVSSPVSTGNGGGLRHNARYPDKDPHTYYVFDYRPPGAIQGCHGFICYGYDGKPSTLPSEVYIESDLVAWESITLGLAHWKEAHPEEDAYIYMVDRAVFWRSRSHFETLYSHIKWKNIRGWAPLGHNMYYGGILIGGYIPNTLFEPYTLKEPTKRLDRSLAMKQVSYEDVKMRSPERL
ncbi:hypothetical protein PspLS_02420 [Pyricularia sp. CBS 133598]|nr:hypothetical protein PspLS_02420 [Pyricularia sp. CBS 133598]